ncbi:hypothetical protein [Rubrivirga marina]|uniref:Uncharacterized protein n=1 Tax=Rubrivirga marina TaxID=1196024 RepID=A0A271J1E4_9BACT|nr:hypothetical protein [Rubrivirga marina]PAP77312.1 hypothetical protein BSZ37_13140 [Rubrivirga marina]
MAELSAEAERVTDLPAFDRVQDRPGPTPEPPRRLRPGLLAVILAVIAGVAFLVWGVLPDESDPDSVLQHLVTTADAFVPDLGTTQPEEAQALVLDALGWHVAPPDLPALAIVGVGIPTIGTVQPSANTSPSEVQVPAFRFEGTDGERATVFAYDYILLDRVRSSFDLPEGSYAALSEPTPVDSRVVDGQFVVTWRQRAMIFSAVTPSEEVAERIRQAVSS